MKTRSVPAQEKPYPSLVEVTQNQPTFEFNDVEKEQLLGFDVPLTLPVLMYQDTIFIS